MRILTICRGAVVRSVALALIAKQNHHDAVALSADWNSPRLFAILSKWADLILYVEPDMDKLVPEEHRSKAICTFGLEKDVWMNPLHRDLLKIAEREVDRALQHMEAKA